MSWNIADRVKNGAYVMLARRDDGSYNASSPSGEDSLALTKAEGEDYIKRYAPIPAELRRVILADTRPGFVIA